MEAANKQSHLTFGDRQIIQKGIENGSSKKAMADLLGKDKSTIGKEIKLHRELTYKCRLPLECASYAHCRFNRICTIQCQDYVQFTCTRRDRSPGACNGCSKYSSCRFDKFRYYADHAHSAYRDTLVESRAGVNATASTIRELGELIKPLLDKGQSVYAILEAHPEIGLSEKTIYTYIETGVFTEARIPINCLDLKKQVRRVPSKKRQFKPRKDLSYTKGRTSKEYDEYMYANPYARVVQMDTVYNDPTNGPFIQTFKFLRYDLLLCLYHETKTSLNMLAGINLLDEILGHDLFNKEVEVLKTDRGTEFTCANQAEIRPDGTRRTRMFFCDPMASWQKGSLENVHLLLREICPKECDLKAIGVIDQYACNIISSNIDSYLKEKLNGKSSFRLLEFLSPATAKKFYEFGLQNISNPDEVILKPRVLKIR